MIVQRLILFSCIVMLSTITIIPSVSAAVWIPEHEYLAYLDSNEIYTVVGNIKNENDFAILPTISVTVIDNEKIFTKIIQHVPIPSGKEIPFEIKFPEVTGTYPILKPAKLIFEKTKKEPISLEVLYDKTLVKHDDGHLTGRIQNTGNETIYNPKIYAVVHGYEKVLDVSQNIEWIEKIEPGEIREFSMYPDPSITDDIFYYSCFAPVDTTVIPVSAKKNEGNYNFRYDSGAWWSAAKFNDDGTILTMNGYNSYPLDTYANFELPPISGQEQFDVTFNNEPIKFIQSLDDMGNWHVAFSVDPISQGTIVISGFDKGLPPESSLVPDWLKNNAVWWSSDQISDEEFLEGIKFLYDNGIIVVPSKEMTAIGNWKIPQWMKNTSAWWSSDQISDEEFLKGLEYLIEKRIIII